MGFPERLKQLREQKGLTQVELSSALGLSKGAVNNYEQGISSPKADILYKIFKILDCDANFLFQDEFDCDEPIVDLRLKNLIKNYNELSEEGRTQIAGMADYLVQHERLKKEREKTG